MDSNFEEFVEHWELFRGRLVVFLGAGASKDAVNRAGQKLPTAYQLRNDLWARFKDHSSSFDPSALGLMSLEHAAAIIEASAGRIPMAEYLTDRFGCDLPLWQHLALPYLNPVSLFTTNYDELIELGYKRQPGIGPDVLCNARMPVSGRMALYKPHGSLSHMNQPIGQGGLVITQFDYLEMLAEYREMLTKAMTDFNSACVLIIGYSFGDMDIGAQLYRIRKQRGIPWYAVFPREDPQVRRMYSTRFGIEQIAMDFQEFLRELDDRVDFIPEQHKYRHMDMLRAIGEIQ